MGSAMTISRVDPRERGERERESERERIVEIGRERTEKGRIVIDSDVKNAASC